MAEKTTDFGHVKKKFLCFGELVYLGWRIGCGVGMGEYELVGWCVAWKLEGVV